MFPILEIWEVSAKYPSHDTDVTWVSFFFIVKWYNNMLVIYDAYIMVFLHIYIIS